jgi:hypothetical protein
MKPSNTDRHQKTIVSIIGEHPDNDALALSYILKDVVKNDVEFTFPLRQYRGSDLDSHSFWGDLRAEFRAEEPKYVILVRDLDGFISETEKLRNRDEWFRKANIEVKQTGIFFLAIYEMESLILADIQNFNKYYKLKEKPVGNPMMKKKEDVKKLTEKTQKGKYSESDAPKIFQTLDFKTVYDNHKGERSFQAFVKELKTKNLLKDDKELKFKI